MTTRHFGLYWWKGYIQRYMDIEAAAASALADVVLECKDREGWERGFLRSFPSYEPIPLDGLNAEEIDEAVGAAWERATCG